MTVSMKVMSAGDGYKYLLKSVVAGDGSRCLSSPMTRYYAEAGTPPGRWLGSGLHAIGNGSIRAGDMVTGEQLALLIGMGRDPVTGDLLGRAFPQHRSVAQRIAERVAELGPAVTGEQRQAATAAIEAEERQISDRRAVAGFDLTFSVPKSASVMWGVADAGTQAQILEAHHAAVDEVLALFEREVAATRRGVNAGNGAVAQVDVVGIMAAAFDHWDSRLGDPQLHTHVVISNKVKTAGDGRWRSLDSRAIHASLVALSEHYNALLADRMTRLFEVEWEARDRGKDRNPAWEIASVGEDLVNEFSSRSRAIDLEKDRLVAEYESQHGKQPSRTTVIRLRAQATLATRPPKQVESLAILTDRWRQRADRILGADAPTWVRRLTTGPVRRPTLRGDDIPLEVVESVALAVVGRVGEKRTTWRHWNLWAEASRQTMSWRFASADDRETVVARIVEAAEDVSLRLTPPELATTPGVFQRADGTSRFRPHHEVVFSSHDILEAEDRLLARADDFAGPTADHTGIAEARLTDEQITTLTSVAASGRQVDLLVGPAGAGKTTAMAALRHAWEASHGSGSVVGLAPSAVAARVLAEDVGIPCENTAKWLFEHGRGRAGFRPGQLLIIDEATLAGTLALDRLAGIAAAAGAKVLLVGDWAQLQSVEAGGAFAMLANARDDTPELTEIHRFTHDWEKTASLALRDGRTEVIDTYVHHDRISEGTTEQMIDTAYAAWRADNLAGKASVLVVDASHAVSELNSRARAERILGGDTDAGHEVRLTDGSAASAGDLLITRSNDRRLQPLQGGWVRNGDRWRVIAAGVDGSLQVERADQPGASVVLPAAYVAAHVELGYAVTAHRAQGITVDTAHVVVNSSTTRENLYVAMTRGRHQNLAYVAIDQPDDTHVPPDEQEVTATTVLFGVLQHSGAELSAHQLIEAEQEQWGSIAQLAAEYETIAAVAQHDRWVDLIQRCGLTEAQVEDVIDSASFGPLAAELRRAEADRFDPEELLPRIVRRRSLADADDVGAVLVARLRHTLRAPARRGRRDHDLIAGFIPPVGGAMSLESSAALDERRQLIESRAAALAQRAVERCEPWLRRLGSPPATGELRAEWLREAAIVAAYRDRHEITGTTTIGHVPTDSQRLDAACAERAIRRAAGIAAKGESNLRGGARRFGTQDIAH